MAFNLRSIIRIMAILYCLFATVAVGAGEQEEKVDTEFVDVNPRLPRAVALGRYAVNIHNRRERDNLQFRKVVKAVFRTTVVLTHNWKITIEANDGTGHLHRYLASLDMVSMQGSTKLVAFRKLD